MSDFRRSDNRDSRGGGRGGFGGGRGGFGGGRSRGGFGGGGFRQDRDRQMHKAVCAECGNDCEVPFKPDGSKPVLCSNCFRDSRNDRDDRNDGGRQFSAFEDFEDRGPKKHKATCDACGKSCEVPFKPTAGKPVYCDDCFSKGDNKSEGRKSGGSVGSKEIEQLNIKLDAILKRLDSLMPKSAESAVKPEKAKAKAEKADESVTKTEFAEPEMPKADKKAKKAVAKKAAKKSK